jgi:hypothetical protein
MFISDKIVFIHIPRTAGTSFQKYLKTHYKSDNNAINWINIRSSHNEKSYQIKTDNKQLRTFIDMDREHYTYSELYKYYKDIQNRYKFSIVRNPWDRHVSLFEYFNNNLIFVFDKKFRFKDFNQYIDWLVSYESSNTYKDIFLKHFTRNQLDYLIDYKGNIKVDKIFRFEKIKEEFKYFKDNFTLSGELPNINNSNRKHYRKYYTNRSKDIIEQLHKKDIEIFGYSYDNG